MVSTRTAIIHLTPQGFVIAQIQPNIDQSLSDAQDNVQACWEVAQGKRSPVLVDIRMSRTLLPEVRHFYNGENLKDTFSA